MNDGPQSTEGIGNPEVTADCCGGEGQCSGNLPPGVTGGATGGLTPREGCPPPLQWRDILDAYRWQSSVWKLPTSAGELSGRVWGEGPTFLFLNGLSGTSELFALTAYLLKPNFRCVLLDYPTGRRVTWPRLVEAIERSIEHFADDDGCHLFATTFGGALALESARTLGTRVRSLTLQGAFAHLPLTIFERFAASLARWLPGRSASIPFWSELQERSQRLWFPPIDSTRWSFYLENAGQTRIADVASRFAMLGRFDVRGTLRDFETPTLLLQVEGEGSTQARCREELASLLPNCRTEFLHTTGLLTFLTHPHRLARILREFTESLHVTSNAAASNDTAARNAH
jgi:pimeloyl-ACP methyl ester carboxylesterase